MNNKDLKAVETDIAKATEIMFGIRLIAARTLTAEEPDPDDLRGLHIAIQAMTLQGVAVLDRAQVRSGGSLGICTGWLDEELKALAERKKPGGQ